jgi:hypothetical protein
MSLLDAKQFAITLANVIDRIVNAPVWSQPAGKWLGGGVCLAVGFLSILAVLRHIRTVEPARRIENSLNRICDILSRNNGVLERISGILLRGDPQLIVLGAKVDSLTSSVGETRQMLQKIVSSVEILLAKSSAHLDGASPGAG